MSVFYIIILCMSFIASPTKKTLYCPDKPLKLVTYSQAWLFSLSRHAHKNAPGPYL